MLRKIFDPKNLYKHEYDCITDTCYILLISEALATLIRILVQRITTIINMTRSNMKFT